MNKKVTKIQANIRGNLTRKKTITKKRTKKSDDRFPNMVEDDLSERILHHKDQNNNDSPDKRKSITQQFSVDDSVQEEKNPLAEDE